MTGSVFAFYYDDDEVWYWDIIFSSSLCGYTTALSEWETAISNGASSNSSVQMLWTDDWTDAVSAPHNANISHTWFGWSLAISNTILVIGAPATNISSVGYITIVIPEYCGDGLPIILL